jgi:hypothetical protein
LLKLTMLDESQELLREMGEHSTTLRYCGT